MTALLRPAFGGNVGAALVMASIIKRIAGAEGHVLATEWLKHGHLLPDKPGRVCDLDISEPSDKRR